MSRSAAVAAYARWTAAEKDVVSLVDYLLECREDLMSRPPRTWRPGDVRALLLEALPRKIVADDDVLEHAPDALRSYLRYLEQAGEAKGELVERLLAEVDGAEPHFASAMRDRSRWGVAKTVMSLAVESGVDLGDPAELQAFLAAFNGLPDDLRGQALDPHAADSRERLVLPPAPPVDEEDLRRWAAESVLICRLMAITSFLGPTGRKVTPAGAPKLVDCEALAEACGDADLLAAKRENNVRLRSVNDLPGVCEAWETAVDAGLVHVGSTTATRVPTAGDVLETWREVAAVTLEAPWVEVGMMANDDVLFATQETELDLLVDLYLDGEITVARVVELAAKQAHGRWQPTMAATFVRVFLGRLARLGVVTTDGDPVHHAALTPLGRWWLRTDVLPEHGLVAPELGELDRLPARELPQALEGYPVDAAEDAVARWVAARGEEPAAAELAALLGDPDLTVRWFALEVLRGFAAGPAAARRVLDDADARLYAVFFLLSEGHEVDPSYRREGDQAQLFVELTGAALTTGEAFDLADVPDLDEAFVRDLWRVPSPSTRPVLEHLAADGPKDLRKAAKRALHSLASATP